MASIASMPHKPDEEKKKRAKDNSQTSTINMIGGSKAPQTNIAISESNYMPSAVGKDEKKSAQQTRLEQLKMEIHNKIKFIEMKEGD